MYGKEEYAVLNRIRELRQEKDTTQQELANAVGISRPYLSDIENDKCEPSGKIMIRIARFFQLKVEDIFLPNEYTIVDSGEDDQQASA